MLRSFLGLKKNAHSFEKNGCSFERTHVLLKESAFFSKERAFFWKNERSFKKNAKDRNILLCFISHLKFKKNVQKNAAFFKRTLCTERNVSVPNPVFIPLLVWYYCFRTFLSANIWLKLEPEPKLWSKSEPEQKINNFCSATLQNQKLEYRYFHK